MQMADQPEKIGMQEIPFSRGFVNFWMGWWILISISPVLVSILWPFFIYFEHLFLLIGSLLWSVQGFRIFQRNLGMIEDWRVVLVFIPLMLGFNSRGIYGHYALKFIDGEISREPFTTAEIASIITFIFAWIIIRIGFFIYVKWYLKNHGEYLEDVEFSD